MKVGRLGVRVSGCQVSAGVCGCTRLRWPTDVPLRGNIGVVGRDFQIFKKSVGPKLWKTVVERKQPILEAPGGPLRAVKNCFSTLKRTVVCSVRPSPSARADRRLQRKTVSQRSGAPGRFRAARPVVMNSRDSLAALNEMTTVQVKGPYSVSRADGRPWHSCLGT